MTEPEEPAAAWLAPKLGGWANQVWARFGGAPVYLVGSSTTSPAPRDVDILIVMRDADFHARYGTTDDEHRDATNGILPWSPGMRRCYAEVAGLTRRMQPWLNMPIDLKVRPQGVDDALYAHYSANGKTRVRLDEMGDGHPPMPRKDRGAYPVAALAEGPP